MYHSFSLQFIVWHNIVTMAISPLISNQVYFSLHFHRSNHAKNQFSCFVSYTHIQITTSTNDLSWYSWINIAKMLKCLHRIVVSDGCERQNPWWFCESPPFLAHLNCLNTFLPVSMCSKCIPVHKSNHSSSERNGILLKIITQKIKTSVR